MKRFLAVITMGVMSLALSAQTSSTATTAQQDTGVKQDMKTAGHATKRATQKTAHTVAHTTKKGVHKAAHATRKGAAKTEQKTRTPPPQL